MRRFVRSRGLTTDTETDAQRRVAACEAATLTLRRILATAPVVAVQEALLVTAEFLRRRSTTPAGVDDVSAVQFTAAFVRPTAIVRMSVVIVVAAWAMLVVGQRLAADQRSKDGHS